MTTNIPVTSLTGSHSCAVGVVVADAPGAEADLSPALVAFQTARSSVSVAFGAFLTDPDEDTYQALIATAGDFLNASDAIYKAFTGEETAAYVSDVQGRSAEAIAGAIVQQGGFVDTRDLLQKAKDAAEAHIRSGLRVQEWLNLDDYESTASVVTNDGEYCLGRVSAWAIGKWSSIDHNGRTAEGNVTTDTESEAAR